MFYVGVKYTAKVKGSTAVAVRCEKCGTKYYYRLDRTATAFCDAPYGIGRDSAQKRGRQAARRRLRIMLEDNIEPVPCPHCGWIQEEMIPLLRESRFRTLRTCGIVFPVVGFICAALAALSVVSHTLGGRGGIEQAQVFGVPAVIGLTVGAILLLVRRYKYACYDPNDPEKEEERRELGRKLSITREEADALMNPCDD